MNIDTTATILQVSPASATRAEVAGPQTAPILGAGFAQLLAALLAGGTPAPAADSQPVATGTDRPDARSIPKPAEPATPFDGIYAIFGSQPAVPSLPQPQLVPAQMQPSAGPPPGTGPLPARCEGTGLPPLPAALDGGNNPAAAAAVSLPAVNVMPANSAAQLQVGQNSPQVSAPQVCPAVKDEALSEANRFGSPIQQSLTLPDPATATPSPTVDAVTPTTDSGSAAQVTQPNLEFSAAAESQSRTVDAVLPSPQTEGTQSSSSQAPVAGTASPAEKLGVGMTDVPSPWASGFASSNVGNAIARATSWSVGQLHLAHSEAGAKRDLLASIARKFGNNVGSVFQELVQRVGQMGGSAVSEAHLPQQQADGQSVGDAIPDALPVNGTDHHDNSGLLQNLADTSAHVSHGGQTNESLTHHDHTTLSQLPQRLAEIVTARMEQPHSADQSSVVLRLDPPELGRVTVHVSMANDVVSIRLVASDDGSRQILETHLNDLQQSLTDQGVSLSHCQVEWNAGSGESPDRNRHWPIPGETELFPGGSRPAPAVANPVAQSTSRTRLDYVA